MWDNEAKYAPSSNVAALKARIEALEAALRIIDDDLEYDSGSPGEFRAIIRKALAPEQDK